MILSGETITAPEALKLGLVSKVIPTLKLMTPARVSTGYEPLRLGRGGDQRERVLYCQPTGPTPLYHYDD